MHEERSQTPRGGATDPGTQPSGAVLAGISNSSVRLYREHFGRGPTGAKTYALDEVVVCVLRDGLTTVEKTLFERGKGSIVREMRSAFQEAVAERFTSVVEELTGRRVVAFMSQAHVDPDLAVEIFFLEEPVEAPAAIEVDLGAEQE
jgi:uncharacterized protein YbcI